MNFNEFKISPFSPLIGWLRCGDIEFQKDEFKSDKKHLSLTRLEDSRNSVGACHHHRTHCRYKLLFLKYFLFLQIGSGGGRKWMWNFCNLFGFTSAGELTDYSRGSGGGSRRVVRNKADGRGGAGCSRVF